MVVFDKSFKEIFFSEAISISLGLIAGILLAISTNKLIFIPGILFILPGFLEMQGNLSGTLASRISSGLFIGFIDTKHLYRREKLIKGNIIASFLLALIICTFLGLVGVVFTFFAFRMLVIEILFLPIIAGFIANIIEIPITILTTLYLFKAGHDPNNIMGPFLTSIGDIVSIGSLLLALIII
ncbi:MAG: magnesium transporter [Candidatus Pacearchaeota archaeon]